MALPIARNLLRAPLTLLICVSIVFIVLRLAGDPLASLLPDDTPPDVVEAYRVRFGLDRSLLEQYASYLMALLSGDFGISFRDGRSASAVIAERIPATLALGGAALAFALILGTPLGLQVVESFAQMQSAGQQVGNTSNSTRFPDPLGRSGSRGDQTRPSSASACSRRSQAFNAAGRALEEATELPERRRRFAQMLDAFEDACPGTIPYQPLESYGAKKSVRWRPYSFYFMDLRPDNLSFA